MSRVCNSFVGTGTTHCTLLDAPLEIGSALPEIDVCIYRFPHPSKFVVWLSFGNSASLRKFLCFQFRGLAMVFQIPLHAWLEVYFPVQSRGGADNGLEVCCRTRFAQARILANVETDVRTAAPGTRCRDLFPQQAREALSYALSLATRHFLLTALIPFPWRPRLLTRRNAERYVCL